MLRLLVFLGARLAGRERFKRPLLRVPPGIVVLTAAAMAGLLLSRPG